MKRTLIFLLILCLIPAGALANLLSVEEMTESAGGKAQFTIAGMPGEEYYAAVASCRDWIAVLNAEDPKNLFIDLERKYSWEELEELFYDISAHPIAHVEIIDIVQSFFYAFNELIIHIISVYRIIKLFCHT